MMQIISWDEIGMEDLICHLSSARRSGGGEFINVIEKIDAANKVRVTS